MIIYVKLQLSRGRALGYQIGPKPLSVKLFSGVKKIVRGHCGVSDLPLSDGS